MSTDGSLNKAIAKYIEHKLFSLADQLKRASLHQTNPQDIALSQSDEADAKRFLSEMLDLFPLVGLTAFQATPAKPGTEEDYLTLSARGITAHGFDSDQGFVVLAGSHAAPDEVPALAQSYRQIRKQLQDQGMLVRDGQTLKLTKDRSFNSPTQAANVFLGCPVAGPFSLERQGRQDFE